MTDEQPANREGLRQQVNKTGFPFQLAVENHIRTTKSRHEWSVVHSEFPAGDYGFVDLLLQREHILGAVECKNSTNDWIFVLRHNARDNVIRCRLQWYNGRAPDQVPPTNPYADKVFCGDFNMCEGSYEAEFAVTKTATVPMLEKMSEGLLRQAHEIVAAYDRRRAHGWEPIVPIIVTSSRLFTCRYEPSDDHLVDGSIAKDEGEFREVQFVRFRKSFADQRSNFYEEDELDAAAFHADRERTVFVVQARALSFFLTGFRVFMHNENRIAPPAYMNPPGW